MDRSMLAEVSRLRLDLLLLEGTLDQYEVAPDLSYDVRVARILGKLRTVEGELRTMKALVNAEQPAKKKAEMQFIHEYSDTNHRLTCGSYVGDWVDINVMAVLVIGDNTYVAFATQVGNIPIDTALLLVSHNTSVA